MVKEQVIEKLSTLVTAAFGLVAALAWNSAIQAIFKNVFGEQSSIPAMLGYAAFVTVIAVIITLWIGKAAEKSKAISDKYVNHIKNKLRLGKKNGMQKAAESKKV